ncbi:MAG TPA: GDP-L-fucose synthase [Porticoccaceae bacterium]|nr:GDP-L-fucose synthase [Porticoccaceae bacterium]HIK79664.1 GDP-L-fucose synthase [Porticoccaceae bacterium]
MNKDSKIYVAGHRGLVGSAIIRALQVQGYDNILLRTSSELDLCNQAVVDAFFAEEKPSYVFLAAAKVGGIYANDTFPADFIRNNLQIQTNVIDAAYRNGVIKLAFLGSSCIYPKFAPQPMLESCLLTGELEPTNEWYAIAKIAGIKMCQAYRKQYGFNAISLMPTNLYGPNDNFDLNNSHVLPALIRKFHLAKLAKAGDVNAIQADEVLYGLIPDDLLSSLGLERRICNSLVTTNELQITSHLVTVQLWGSGSPCREFLHVDDLAEACLYLMDCYDSGDIMNVGVGSDVSIKSLAELVGKIVGFNGKVVWDSSRADGTPRKLMDVNRIHSLGWMNKIQLQDGIEQAYAHYKDRGEAL